jgi:hypothetical protein
VATETTLVAAKTVLESIRDSASPDVFVEGRGETGTDVTPTGSVYVVPDLWKLININRIYVRQVFGSGTKFRVELLTKNPLTELPGAITDLDVIYDNKGSVSPGFNAQNNSWDHIIYDRLIAKNAYNLNELYLRITPDQGTSNKYLFLINGFKLK